MNRPKNYYRIQRKRAIKRKLTILQFNQSKSYFEEVYSDKRRKGMLHKGKIHCSCPMCRTKSYDELKIRDLAQLENYNQQLDELNDE